MTLNQNDGAKKSKAAKAAGRKRAPHKTAGKQPASMKRGAGSDGSASAVAKKRSRAGKSAAGSKERTASRAKAATQVSAENGVAQDFGHPQGQPQQGGGPDPFEIAKQTMKGAVPEIVKSMVKMAKQGSCSHAKTVLEMTGAKHMFEEESEGRASGEPWAKLVLERMQQAEQESGVRERPPVVAGG